MDRPLAVGGVSGVATSLVYSFLLSLYHEFESHPGPLPIPSLSCPLDCPGLQLEDINIWIFLAGVLVGCCIGPVIDLLYLFKQRWRRWIWRAVAREEHSTRALHKVLA